MRRCLAAEDDLADELLRAYAPQDPVRLIGVRVAGFDDVAATGDVAFDDPQLRLPLAIG